MSLCRRRQGVGSQDVDLLPNATVWASLSLLLSSVISARDAADAVYPPAVHAQGVL